jgi:hypothetical protein
MWRLIHKAYSGIMFVVMTILWIILIALWIGFTWLIAWMMAEAQDGLYRHNFWYFWAGTVSFALYLFRGEPFFIIGNWISSKAYEEGRK